MWFIWQELIFQQVGHLCRSRVYNLPYSAPLQAEWIKKPLASEDASVCTFDYVSCFICAWQYKIFKTENSLLKLKRGGEKYEITNTSTEPIYAERLSKE